MILTEARALTTKHAIDWRAMEDGWRARELLAEALVEIEHLQGDLASLRDRNAQNKE